MNVLILNWRDIKNPESGGAEVLTQEIAKRWVKLGHNVTQFSSIFDGAKAEETIDGVKIIRKGHPDARFLLSSVHFLAFRFYREYGNKFDVVVDEAHGLPFFTSLYVRGKKVVLICEVAEDLWLKMFGLFFGSVGQLLENIYLRFMYKNVSYLTISDSTKDRLINKGVNPQNITVLPMGITTPKKIKRFEKEKNPTIIFVGRISKSKGIEDAIEALKLISKHFKNVKLWIVGDGDKKYINYLKREAKKISVLNRIIFWGFVSEDRKFELMSKAHLLVAPSVKEGWGLIVPEAAYVGTPSIVYDVLGLRDIVVNGQNGIIVKTNKPSEIANEVIKILTEKELYSKLQINAKQSSYKYNWDNTARVAFRVLEGGR